LRLCGSGPLWELDRLSNTSTVEQCKSAKVTVTVEGTFVTGQAQFATMLRKYGYDGPCPPWNDDNLHHYHFTVYALSVSSLNLPKDFDAPTAMEAMKGKILAQGQELGLFTQNPAKGAKTSE